MNNNKQNPISEILKAYAKELSDVQPIVDSANHAFKGGLFSKPQWIKDKEEQVRNGSH